VSPSEFRHIAAQVNGQRPFVSIVLTGRNDGYGGDFLDRFFRTIRFNHQQLRQRGIDHEIVFVEWAPPREVPLLCDVLAEAVPELDFSVCSWYVVDARYQTALSLNPTLAYLEFVAKNVGVRRACGRFVLTSNCDVFLGRHVLDVLQREALEEGVLYRAPRYDLKLGTDASELEWEVLEDPRNLARIPEPLDPPFFAGGTGDFVLMARQTFHDLGGFNEVYRVARIGIDRNILVKALSSGVRIEDIGGPVYHFNHIGSYRLKSDAYSGREATAPWGNRRWHSSGVSYVNPPTWGLADSPVTRVDRHWYLDFAWTAVPPLVNLRRLVLPTARLGGPEPGRYVVKE